MRMRVTGIHKAKSGKDEPLYTKIGDERPCSQCGRNPRQMGSSRCKQCSIDHGIVKYNQERLEKRLKNN